MVCSTPQDEDSLVRDLTPEHVTKALAITSERFGNEECTCKTLRTWAASGHVTPARQRLSVDVVEEGIRRFYVKETREQQRGLATSSSLLSRELLAVPSSPRKRRVLDQHPSFVEAKQARVEEEAHARSLAAARVVEVLADIDGHMEEILRRSGGDVAVGEWRQKPGCRDLYLRLVHAIQREVQEPVSLHAELMAHQVEGLEWLASLHTNGLHGILADEMGLGKTIQTIAFLLYLKEQGNVGPHLIVAPKSTLSHWESEFCRFAPCVPVHLVSGEDRTKARAAVQNLRAGVCVTNFEQVHRNEWFFQTAWKVVVVDEGHRLKNPETVLHGAMTRLKCQMRLLLTGTPLQNGLNELWALLHYLLPDIFTCLMDFKAWFSAPFKSVGFNEMTVRMDAEQEQRVIEKMHAMLAPFLLQRLKSEVLVDLPSKVEVTVRVPLSAWQRSAYKDLEGRTIRLMSGSSASSEVVNNALMHLRKIVLHPYLFQTSYDRNKDLYRVSGKAEAFDRMLGKLLARQHKVLVFSQFTTVLDVLQDLLEWRQIAFVRLDGSVSHEQRQRRVERFREDPTLMVFLLSARAGGLGLNLQVADTVVLFDLDWNPQNDRQAVARVHRVGQTRDVRVIRLVSDSAVERYMEKRCREKLDIERKIMGAGVFRKATGEQRRDILQEVFLSFREDEDEDSAERALTTPAELNQLLARTSEELECFRALDRDMFQGDVESVCLVRHDRLMRESEVPTGFTTFSDE